MRNKLYRNELIALTVLFVAVLTLAFLTYSYRDIETPSTLLSLAIEHHMLIMVLLVIISIIVGYYSSYILYTQILRQQKDSQSMLDVIMLFLSTDEKMIINFLVQSDGSTTQAEISRLPGMTRVKTFRSLQRMQQKNLIEITSHGKIRNVKLKESVTNVLLKDN